MATIATNAHIFLNDIGLLGPTVFRVDSENVALDTSADPVELVSLGTFSAHAVGGGPGAGAHIDIEAGASCRVATAPVATPEDSNGVPLLPGAVVNVASSINNGQANPTYQAVVVGSIDSTTNGGVVAVPTVILERPDGTYCWAPPDALAVIRPGQPSVTLAGS